MDIEFTLDSSAGQHIIKARLSYIVSPGNGQTNKTESVEIRDLGNNLMV